MKSFLAMLCLFIGWAVTTQVASAQFTAHGVVVDAQSKEPVPDATININGTGIVATSGEKGTFEISSTADFGKITVTRAGYHALEVQVADKSASLTVSLIPSGYTLKGVEVSGSALSHEQLSRAQSVGVISQGDLQRGSGLLLGQSLNTVPGVNMQTRTPWGGQRITLRGYYPNVGNSANFNGLGYQLFLNDIPVSDASGSTIMDDIDFSTLGSAEVVKGPASAQYGGAIAGTVILHTLRPAVNGTTLEQQVLGGGNGLFRTNTGLRSASEHGSYIVNYGHQTYKGFRPHSASQKDYLMVEGEVDASPQETFSGFFSYGHSSEELAGEIDSAAFYNRIALSDSNYLANGSRVQIESFRAGITSTYRINGTLSNSTTLFATGNTQAQPFAHGFTDYTRFNFGGRTAFLFAQQSGSTSVNGSLGVAFQRSTVTSNGVFIVPIPSAPQNPSAFENYAINYYPYTEWTVGLPEEISVTAGASLNFNEFGYRNMLTSQKLYNGSSTRIKSFDAVLTPRLSVLKMLGNDVSVYASVSSGFTPPLLSNIVQSNGTVDTALNPEKAVQYEFGSKGNLFERMLTYQVSFFDMEITDKLVSQTVNAVTFTTNAGKQRNQGIEASLGCLIVDNPADFLSNVHPWIAYTYTNAKFVDFKSDNNNSPSTINYSWKKVPLVAPHMISAGLDLGTNAGFTANANLQFMDKVPVTIDNNNSMKSYTLVNLRGGYKNAISDRVTLNLFGGVDNVFNSTYYSLLFVGPNIGGLAQPADGGTGDGYILPGPYNASGYVNVSLQYGL
jgi:iron complex outermembrane recepter protein